MAPVASPEEWEAQPLVRRLAMTAVARAAWRRTFTVRG